MRRLVALWCLAGLGLAACGSPSNERKDASLSTGSDGGLDAGGDAGDVDNPNGLHWPLSGDGAPEWSINNYVDLDPTSPGVLDYMGGAKTYDGHQGVDIDIANFRVMDQGVPVYAARDGTVTDIQDGNFDRQVACVTNAWNVVTVTHSDGTYAYYGHLRSGSMVVKVGDPVTVGEKLALVGSSGCSTGPHLHFEMRTANGTLIDPFQQHLWQHPPPYTPPLAYMDSAIRTGWFTNADDAKSPPPNTTTAAVNGPIAVAVYITGGANGDTVEVSLKPTGGGTGLLGSRVLDGSYRTSYWYWNFTLGSLTGTWNAEIRLNGTLVKTLLFQVN